MGVQEVPLHLRDARMVQSLDDYPWSSHHDYVGRANTAWVTTEFGLGVLGKTVDQARAAYDALIEGRLKLDVAPWLPSVDARVLGTDRFLASLPPPRMRPRSTLSLEELANRVCERNALSIDVVRSPSRVRSLSAARAEIAQIAIEQKIASLHEVARFLGRGPSSVLSLIHRCARR